MGSHACVEDLSLFHLSARPIPDCGFAGGAICATSWTLKRKPAPGPTT